MATIDMIRDDATHDPARAAYRAISLVKMGDITAEDAAKALGAINPRLGVEGPDKLLSRTINMNPRTKAGRQAKRDLAARQTAADMIEAFQLHA